MERGLIVVAGDWMLQSFRFVTRASVSQFKAAPTRAQQFQLNCILPIKVSRMASSTSGSPKWTAQKVRSTFLEYFEKHDHTLGESFLVAYYLIFIHA